MNTIKDIESQRDALSPGNLSIFHHKCYKPNCHCAHPDTPGHPGWQLTRKDENQKKRPGTTFRMIGSNQPNNSWPSSGGFGT